MIILPMPGAERLVGLARDLAATAGAVEVHEFPDGESRVRLLGYVRDEDVVLAAHLDRPDAKVLPLLFAAETARDLGAASVGLVAVAFPAAFTEVKASARTTSPRSSPGPWTGW